jgi:hypothetical protein
MQVTSNVRRALFSPQLTESRYSFVAEMVFLRDRPFLSGTLLDDDGYSRLTEEDHR